MVIDHPDGQKVSTSPSLADASIVWVAFLVRTSSLLAQGLWRDEVDQWRFAFLSPSELLANLTRPGWNGPLYSPLLRGWIALAGESVFAMRFLSVLFGVLSVVIAHALIHRMIGSRQARLTALLIAVSPYMTWYAQEIKMYTWVPLLVSLALYGMDRAVDSGQARWWWLVFGATTLAVYSHILAALLVPILGLWFWFHPSRSPRAWVGGLATAAGLTLPYLPLLRWQAALAFVPRETGFPARSLGQMVGALLTGWSAGISQGTWPISAIVVLAVGVGAALAGAGALRLVRIGRVDATARLVAWLMLPLAGVWLVSQWSPIFTDRYLIWSSPAYYTLAAVGLIGLHRAWRPLGVLGLGLTLVFAGHGLIVQATVPIKPQFRQAVDAVAARGEAGDLLLFQIPYNRIVYEAYAGDGLGAWAEAPFTNWREPDGTYQVGTDYVAREMRRIVAGRDRVWLVYSEAEIWDDRELVKAWLDDTHVLQYQEHFAGVSLFRYGRPAR
ncbi:MAG: glycosyltransferase family 39 protein [Anaerolineae bacterium]|nr:glycosyltransferase family 39 protein [Anaerolineae bacterium]